MASTTPVVEQPAPDEVTAERTPLVRWQDFRSPEHRAFENRSLAVIAGSWVAERQPQWRTDWLLWEGNARSTSVRIGDPRGGPGRELADGTYWLGVTYREQRVFGPVRLRRAARSGRHFTVQD